MFLDVFALPTMEDEETLASRKYYENGGYLDNGYPCRLFTQKGLERLDFEKITILYGGNGSGKSTLLNLIANKLSLKRIAPYNSSELLVEYIKKCKYKCGFDDYGDKQIIPSGSAIITSDDVFEYMLTVRHNNEEIDASKDFAKEEWARNRYGKTVHMRGLGDYEELRAQVLARRKSVSRRKFMQEMIGKEVKLNSNGETALMYFEENLAANKLYCLDEPENSLSAKKQLELVELLEYKSRSENCQLIIATHSPFVLSLKNAKIYDLDSLPVDIKKWYELENVKAYYDFFSKNDKFFR